MSSALSSVFANSVDPDETPPLGQSDQDLHCLPVCKNRFEKFARIFSRRHKQTTFSDADFLGILKVNKAESAILVLSVCFASKSFSFSKSNCHVLKVFPSYNVDSDSNFNLLLYIGYVFSLAPNTAVYMYFCHWQQIQHIAKS